VSSSVSSAVRSGRSARRRTSSTRPRNRRVDGAGGDGRLALGDGVELAEEVEHAAEVEHQELGLVLARAEQVGARAGAAAEHLAELDAGEHWLEEDEVDDLRDVDAGVEHVDGDGDRGLLVRSLKSSMRVSTIGSSLTILRANFPPSQAGIVRVESLDDVFRVVDAAGEDDGLAEGLAAVDLDAVLSSGT
jgi:hypothetical protein